MKRQFITIAEYLNPPIVKPIKVVDKEPRKKTKAEIRLNIRQALSNPNFLSIFKTYNNEFIEEFYNIMKEETINVIFLKKRGTL